MQNSIIAVSQADPNDTQENIRDASILGFLYIAEVDDKRKKVKVLAPLSGRLPNKAMIWGSWPESIRGLVDWFWGSERGSNGLPKDLIRDFAGYNQASSIVIFPAFAMAMSCLKTSILMLIADIIIKFLLVNLQPFSKSSSWTSLFPHSLHFAEINQVFPSIFIPYNPLCYPPPAKFNQTTLPHHPSSLINFLNSPPTTPYISRSSTDSHCIA